MAWKDNALGITIDRTMDADYATLKAQGLAFVIIDAGTGFDMNPAFNDQYAKAVGAGLPVLVQYTPISAIDDYTFAGPALEEIPALKKLLGTRKINGLIISMERYWVGWDIEQGHNPIRNATATAISYTAKEFADTFTKQYAPSGVPVLIRSNDNFVTKYAQDMSAWTDNFGFVLADWRYRTRATDGEYSIYTLFPKTTITKLVDLAAILPPDGSKNPLVPGNAPKLMTWEFAGSVTMPVSLVKGWDGKVKTLKVALFNGNVDAMKAYLVPQVTTPPPVDPPVDITPDPDPVDVSKLEDALSRIEALCVLMAVDTKAIRSVFRE